MMVLLRNGGKSLMTNNDGQDDDPYEQTTPERMIAYLESVQ